MSTFFRPVAWLLLLLGLAGSALAARLDGIVRDAQSELPLGGVVVISNRNNAPAVTNGDGFYLFEGLESGPLLLTVIHPGYQPITLGVEIQPGENHRNINLVPEGPGEFAVVQGTASTVDGQPIPGVVIHGPAGPTDEVVHTGENGHYEYLAFLGSGSFLAEHPLFQPHFNESVTVGVEGLVYDFVMESNGQQTAFLHGHVAVAGQDQPIGGALVRVFQGNGFPLSDITGNNGSYEIGGLMAGDSAWVEVSAQGFEGWEGRIALQAGGNLLDVSLEPGGEPGVVLNGIVRNAVSNARIQGVEIHFLAQPDHPGVTTNNQGHFHAEGLLPGPCVLHLTHPEFQDHFADRLLEPGENFIELYLTPQGGGGQVAGLSGVVMHAFEGTPVQGAELALSNNAGQRVETGSGPEGGYTFANIPSGTWSLEVHAQGFQPWQQPITLAPGPNQRMVELLPGGNGDHQAFLTGTVTDALDGQPLEGVEIHLPGPHHGRVLFTGPDGQYHTPEDEPLYSGPASLSAGRPGYFPADLQVILQPGENVFDFTLFPLDGNGPSAGLTGTVLDGETGLPIAGAWLSAPGLMGEPVTTTSNEQGVYQMDGLMAGTSELFVTAMGYRHRFITLLLQPGVNTFDPVLEAQGDPENQITVMGAVRDMLSRQPIAGAELLFSTPDISWTQESDGQGRFVFGPMLIQGHHATLRANAEGYQEQVLELNLHGMGHHQGDTLRVDLNLVPLDGGMLMGMLAGHVRTDDTNLPVYAMIEAISAQPGDPRTYTTFTGPNGHWDLSLPMGGYFLLCRTLSGGNNTPVDYVEFWENAAGIEDATVVEVQPGDTQNDFDFGIPRVDGGQIEVQLSGRVTDDQQQGLPDVTLRFWTPEGELIDARVDTDETGHWGATIILDRLPIVPFSISAEHGSFLMEFFSNAQSFADATQFSFTSDASIANMNFTLAEAEEGLGSLSGQLADEDGSPRADGLVVALSPENGTLMTVPTDLNGNYMLNTDSDTELALLYFVPGHMPVFSGESWSLEDALSYSGNQTLGNLDMNLQGLPTTDGNSLLTGFVSNTAGQPLAGALLLAVSADGQDMRYALSGPEGSYRLDGLADQREYTLFCSLAGFHSSQSVITTDEAVGFTRLHDLELVPRGTTDVDEGNDRPLDFALLGNWPNPFNPTTTLSYELDRSQRVNLSVYNIQGALVATLVDGAQDAGRHSLTFDASGLASGLYVYRLEGESRTISRRMLLLK
jgi:hypothetical protein